MKDLKTRIKESGLKQNFIAAKVGIHSVTMYRIVAGVQPYVSEELMNKINEVLTKANA